jgi:hypothetical protein
MNRTLLAMVLVGVGLTSVGLLHSASKRHKIEPGQNEKHGTYKQRLRRAKERGDKKLRSHAVIPLYAQVDLDGAIDIYDLVIGEFVSSKSFPTDDDGNIVTWYKFKIDHTPSKGKTPRIVDPAPRELLPLAQDEVLVWKTGGSVELDGMEIEMEEVGFPPFEKSKKYLLVLALDHAKRTGNVEVGPSGALIVNPDDTLEPITKNRTFFKTEIENRYGTSVSKLKEKFK